MNLLQILLQESIYLYLNAGDKLINKNILKNLLNLNLHEKYNYFFYAEIGKYKKGYPRHGRLIEIGREEFQFTKVFCLQRFYKKIHMMKK